jgi:hypothetical protein
MRRTYPIRSRSHELEEESRRFFVRALPAGWTAEAPEKDYGVDLRVEIFENHQATGLELLVQLKATETEARGQSVPVRLKASTYNYLRDRLQVAMLVKYVTDEQEGYWILFRDVPSPPAGQQTYTIRIPRENRLSSIPWDDIRAHVRRVTDRKLGTAHLASSHPKCVFRRS